MQLRRARCCWSAGPTITTLVLLALLPLLLLLSLLLCWCYNKYLAIFWGFMVMPDILTNNKQPLQTVTCEDLVRNLAELTK
eukprot:2376093-Amphidinium_carterae.1